MAARKLQQEVDKCFKKVDEGVQEFEAILEKLEQSNNHAQKEKLEDNLKREIKKLQRLRDQIKTWAASNEIKDKAPLIEKRHLIERQMERFKTVEKAMKTKAYSKEGLSAAAKLDPKEQAKVEAGEFLSSTVDELEQQIESLEAESENIQATMKKGKAQSAKAERLAQIEHIIERHKWHQGKLELIRRSLENGGVETEQVNDLEESIRYYVSDGMNDNFAEDEEMYSELNLEEDAYGMIQDNDKGSSQDAKSEPDEPVPEAESKPVATGKAKSVVENAMAGSSGRKPSGQVKSPLPTLATLHTPLPNSNGSVSAAPAGMRPAPLPARPAGEGLKYASAAAAAAAASERSLGISPLPPPPGSQASKASAANSPALGTILPASGQDGKQTATTIATATAISTATATATATASPAPSFTRPAPSSGTPAATPKTEPSKPVQRTASDKAPAVPPATQPVAEPSDALKRGEFFGHPTPPSPPSPPVSGIANGVKPAVEQQRRSEPEEEEEPESIYHLPSSLQDLVSSFETSRKRPPPPASPASHRLLAVSQASCPFPGDSEVPRIYRPDAPLTTSQAAAYAASGFPREPLAQLEDPRLYERLDPDTLFYVFYYKQGTTQQYLAAKALKEQSWRFHKQYQTWFQRHEEPKNITEEFEQGTYRFFDYESTWMNRRKADFRFAYKFLEDDVE